jgi:cysteinyl-tRNA synthetase
MKLHNTLTRQVEELKPFDPNQVSIYSCGPTVYNNAHIGNLSSYIYADTLRRTLELSGYLTKHVMNYTDVDDKTIRTSLEYYPEEESRPALWKFTEEYIVQFLDDMQAIGNDVKAIQFTRATDYIEDMQRLITELYEKKMAYIADDGVYFSIAAYKAAGKRYGQLLELTVGNTSAERIQNDEYDKESAHDFALWKLKKDNEPSWDFRLDGRDLLGRPGWHIECSAMSRTMLGQPFDIHTGGIDLVFPHHENEIAQSTAANEDPLLAQFFVHNEHLLVDSKKMSKSLGNFYTLQDIKDNGFDPLAFRLMVLQSHYRSQSNFTWENLRAAQNRLKDYRAFADLLWELPDTAEGPGTVLYDTKQAINEALQNDLNIAQALATLSELESKWIVILTESKQTFREFLAFLDKAFGLNLSATENISDEHYGLIAQRDKARSSQDWEASDKLRDQLASHGIGLRDTPEGSIWYHL